MNDFERLRELLMKMPDSYEDAVHGTMAAARKDKCAKELIDFLENNPQATTSDLLEYITNEIWKIPYTDEYKEYIKKKDSGDLQSTENR